MNTDKFKKIESTEPFIFSMNIPLGPISEIFILRLEEYGIAHTHETPDRISPQIIVNVKVQSVKEAVWIESLFYRGYNSFIPLRP